MSLKTLEQRFLERAGNIYTQYKNPDALTTILPDTVQSKQNIKDDVLYAPVSISLNRDRLLLRNLNRSPIGARFRNTQLVLQTGNTFAETRAYNPANLLINGIPGLRIPRHIGLSVLGPKTNAGALQKDTIESFRNSGLISGLVKGLLSRVVSPLTALTATPETISDGTETGVFYVRPEDKVELAPNAFTTFSLTGLPTNQSLRFRGQQKKVGLYQSVDDVKLLSVLKTPFGIQNGTFPLQYYNPERSRSYPLAVVPYMGFITGFNELNIGASKFTINTNTDKPSIYTASDFRFKEIPPQSIIVDTFDKSRAVFYDQKSKPTLQINGKVEPFVYRNLESYNLTNGVLKGNWPYSLTTTSNLNVEPRATSKKTGIQDPYNLDSYLIKNPSDPNRKPITQNNVDYASIYAPDNDASKTADSIQKSVTDSLSDLIKFEFRDAKNQNPVRFRALISTLKENIKTEFNEQRYVGRIERYVTYNGAKRSISMTFNVIAFSQDEIQNVWKRINYLSGLAFPKGVTQSGFMRPPLFKISIGGIYDMQPAYIDSLSYDFIDNDTVFDIDVPAGGVPQYIKVDMAMTLMEKRSKFFDSPFYKIVEDKATAESAIEDARATAAASAQEAARAAEEARTMFATTQDELNRAIAVAYGYAGAPLEFGTELDINDEAALYRSAAGRVTRNEQQRALIDRANELDDELIRQQQEATAEADAAAEQLRIERLAGAAPSAPAAASGPPRARTGGTSRSTTASKTAPTPKGPTSPTVVSRNPDGSTTYRVSRIKLEPLTDERSTRTFGDWVDLYFPSAQRPRFTSTPSTTQTTIQIGTPIPETREAIYNLSPEVESQLRKHQKWNYAARLSAVRQYNAGIAAGSSTQR